MYKYIEMDRTKKREERIGDEKGIKLHNLKGRRKKDGKVKGGLERSRG